MYAANHDDDVDIDVSVVDHWWSEFGKFANT